MMLPRIGQTIRLNFMSSSEETELHSFKSRITDIQDDVASIELPTSEVTGRTGLFGPGTECSVWYVGEEKLSMKQAEEHGKTFLNKHGYENMVVSEIDSYERSALFTFVHTQDDVRIYPDSVIVEVALDNGEVTAFNATEYLFNHKKRILSKPKLSKEEARKKVNPSVKVTNQRLALIEGKNDGNEVLTWELTGSFEGSAYMIYVNAITGEEEEVVKMDTGGTNESERPK